MAIEVEHFPAKNPNPLLGVTKYGTILYSNEAGEPLLNEWGVRVGEKLPSSIVDIVQRVISRNSSERMEAKIGKKMYLIVFQPLSEEECVNVYGFDISDQKDLEEKLYESDRSYHLPFENMLDGLAYCKMLYDDCGCPIDFIYLDTNRAFEQLTGLKKVKGKRATELFPGIKKSHRELFDIYGRAALTGQPERFEIEFKPLEMWFLISVYSMDREYFVAVFNNITERKRTEAAIKKSRFILAKSQEMAQVGNWAWNVQTGEMNGSDENYRIYGYEPGDVLPGKDWAMARTYPDDRALLADFIHSVKQDGRHKNLDYRIIRLDGDIRYVTTVADKIVRDKAGKVKWVYGITQDITERKKVEQALKKAYENLEKIVEERTAELEKAYNSLKESEKGLAEAQKMAHIGNWEWDIATDKAYWSEEMYHIFGHDPQELAPPYNKFLNYIHPDDRNYVNNAAEKAINGKPYSIDYRIVLVNGEERTVHMQSEVTFDEENIPARLKGIVQDITERKRTEENIQKLANIVESSEDAIVTVSLDGIISGWNKGATQIYDYSSEEILGKNVSILTPDNLKYEIKKLIDRIKHGIKIKNYETSRLKKDGTLITVSITLSPVFDIHGKLTDISAIYRDITERKRVEEKLRESEEKYRNIVETANELILITDNEAIITYVNKRMLDMLGYTMEESIGRPIWNFISEECEPIVKTNLEKRRQGRSGSYELKLIRKDGSSLWTFLNAKPLFDKDGKYVGAMSMLTDITERKKAEETLNNIETARKKEIHHRIKNNLQVISSLLDLQAEQFRNREEIRDYEVLEAFRESQDRVISMALIHEELYRGEELDKLNFSPYIEELANTLFQTYKLGNNDIILSIDLEENFFFDMDIAVPLGMIVNELVSNSLKHAFPDRKKGEIQIKLHKEYSTKFENDYESTSTSFILTVSDNGIGIPENLDIKDLDSLGMQLVTSLVDQLDGEFEMKRNNGTEFTIRFIVPDINNPKSAESLL
jgi:PAS domain S-box